LPVVPRVDLRSGFAEAQVCRLHALIPLEVFNIDHLNQKTPAQLKHLKDGLEAV
jgi:hypothetical protein